MFVLFLILLGFRVIKLLVVLYWFYLFVFCKGNLFFKLLRVWICLLYFFEGLVLVLFLGIEICVLLILVLNIKEF